MGVGRAGGVYRAWKIKFRAPDFEKAGALNGYDCLTAFHRPSFNNRTNLYFITGFELIRLITAINGNHPAFNRFNGTFQGFSDGDTSGQGRGQKNCRNDNTCPFLKFSHYILLFIFQSLFTAVTTITISGAADDARLFDLFVTLAADIMEIFH